MFALRWRGVALPRVTLRRAADRLPTKWFGTIAATAFLIVTAAFGGLSTAPAPPLPEIAIGETYTNDQMSITVERMFVTDSVDDFFDASVITGPGDELVVVVATVTNRWDRPLSVGDDLDRAVSVSTGSASDADSNEGDAGVVLDSDTLPVFARTDDATAARTIQPGVPTPLAWIWHVDGSTAQQITNADEVAVTIFDQTVVTGTYLFWGDRWGDPIAAARVVVQPETPGSITLAELSLPPTADTDDAEVGG